MREITLSILLILIFLVSCTNYSTTHVTKLGAITYTPKRPFQVEVFLSRPTQPHRQIAAIEVKSYTGRFEVLREEMVEKAANLGADGVIIENIGILVLKRLGRIAPYYLTLPPIKYKVSELSVPEISKILSSYPQPITYQTQILYLMHGIGIKFEGR